MDVRKTLSGYLEYIDDAIEKVIDTSDEPVTLPSLVMAGVETLSLMADFDMLEKEA